MEFFSFLMNDVLAEPAVLVGLIALVGLVAQKKPFTDCIKGTVKTIMGFVILGAGAGLVVSSLGDFATIFQHAFGIAGVVPNNEAIVSIAQETFGKEMAMIMFFCHGYQYLNCQIHTLEIHLPDWPPHAVYVDDGCRHSVFIRNVWCLPRCFRRVGSRCSNGIFPGYCTPLHEAGNGFRRCCHRPFFNTFLRNGRLYWQQAW